MPRKWPMKRPRRRVGFAPTRLIGKGNRAPHDASASLSFSLQETVPSGAVRGSDRAALRGRARGNLRPIEQRQPVGDWRCHPQREVRSRAGIVRVPTAQRSLNRLDGQWWSNDNETDDVVERPGGVGAKWLVVEIATRGEIDGRLPRELVAKIDCQGFDRQGNPARNSRQPLQAHRSTELR